MGLDEPDLEPLFKRPRLPPLPTTHAPVTAEQIGSIKR